MTAPEIEIRRAWNRLIGDRHDAALDNLFTLHRQPHRRYHTATHVMWVLRHIDDIAPSCDVADIGTVRAAALFHDAVYDPLSTTNEHDSAMLADAVLAGVGFSSARRGAVQRLILGTAHRPGSTVADVDEQVLVDADLAILGSAPAEYTAYATAVRAEFAHLGDDDWRRGRSAFLRGVLGAPAIFHTHYMATRREARARANVAAELSALETDQ